MIQLQTIKNAELFYFEIKTNDIQRFRVEQGKFHGDKCSQSFRKTRNLRKLSL